MLPRNSVKSQEDCEISNNPFSFFLSFFYSSKPPQQELAGIWFHPEKLDFRQHRFSSHGVPLPLKSCLMNAQQ